MKKDINNVIKVLGIRAASGGYEFNVYDEDKNDIQVSFSGTSVPLVSDIRGILSCFFQNAYQIVNVNEFFGFTEIFLSDGHFLDKRKNVDLQSLKMYLPYGALDNIE